ncbi:MAG: DNA translocase FtsK 4TM domain-containing protein [Deltaproteobacteria bacterium]|nr:DNA translocase FtsK 4TM domain-containing protein [Deltaproteobacteria bacterium]
MAVKSKTKKTSSTTPKWQDSKELFVLIFLSLSIYIGISLYSYAPTDPSLQTNTVGQTAVVSNMGGLIGSYIADMLLTTFGYAAYVWVLLLLGYAMYFAFACFDKLTFQTLAGWILLLTTSALALSVFDQGASVVAWGGWIGIKTQTMLTRYTGLYGMWICIATGFLVAMTLMISVSLAQFSIVFVVCGRFFYRCYLACKTFVGRQSLALKKAARKMLKKEEKAIQKGFQAIKQDTQNVIPIKRPHVERAPKPSSLPESMAAVPIVIPERKVATEDAKLPEREPSVEDKAKKSVYKIPSTNLLDEVENQALEIDRDTLLQNASILENKLKDFGVMGKVVEVQPGPVVTMYEFEPAPGVKVNKITALGEDLTLALKALSVRIAPIPGKSVVGIEVANKKRQVVYIKDIIADDVFMQHKSKLAITLGKDISGTPVVGDLRKMPHLLVAGATGSGKSVSVNSMLASVLCKATPEDVRMILVDPKMLELSLYDEIPHLLLPVVTDPRKASAALKWAVREMEKRYRLMADLGVRNIEGYNAKVENHMQKHPRASYEENMEVKPETHEGRMPFIMIVIDELADLMMVASKDVEDSIIRLAQMARASGIHLLLATQRPSVDVITGIIKANMPSRIAFKVSSKIDSRTILDGNGAEQLLGAGDMLYMPPGTSKIQRLHGSFISDDEVARITNFWKEQAKPEYNEEILKPTTEEGGIASSDDPEEDEMYRQALEIVKERQVASISYIQRRLRIGYNRAARLVERMEDDGFLAPGEVGKPREVLTHQMP